MSIFSRKSTITPVVTHSPDQNPTPPVTEAPPSGLTIKGIDIYHGDSVHWQSLKSQGFHFAFIKATEGLGIKDSRFKEHWANAKANGILRGGYHFMHFVSPVAQARFFVETMGALDESDLPPVIDWEYANGNPSKGDDVLAKIFLEEVETLTKRIPIIYTNAYVPDFFNNPSWMARYPLWVAAYRKSQPQTPKPWKSTSFWQFTGNGSPVNDQDIFNGSLDELKAFIKKSILT